jgi:hypothetical protein
VSEDIKEVWTGRQVKLSGMTFVLGASSSGWDESRCSVFSTPGRRDAGKDDILILGPGASAPRR